MFSSYDKACLLSNFGYIYFDDRKMQTSSDQYTPTPCVIEAQNKSPFNDYHQSITRHLYVLVSKVVFFYFRCMYVASNSPVY